MGQNVDSSKKLPNDGYIYPVVCTSCLKLWVDNELSNGEEEQIEMFGHSVPCRRCPRCTHECGGDWPGAKH
jgi:hypothetical protein